MKKLQFGNVKKFIEESEEQQEAPETEEDRPDAFKYEESGGHLDDDAERTIGAAQAAFEAVSSTSNEDLLEVAPEASGKIPEDYGDIFDDLKEEEEE